MQKAVRMCLPSYLNLYWAMSFSSFYLSLPITSPLLATFSLPPSPSVFLPHSLTLPSSLPLLSPFPLPLFLHSFLLFPSVSLSKLRHSFSLSLSISPFTSYSLSPSLYPSFPLHLSPFFPHSLPLSLLPVFAVLPLAHAGYYHF